jgi:hypothetical protein
MLSSEYVARKSACCPDIVCLRRTRALSWVEVEGELGVWLRGALVRIALAALLVQEEQVAVAQMNTGYERALAMSDGEQELRYGSQARRQMLGTS